MHGRKKEHHGTFHRAAFSVGWRWNHEASCVWCLASPVQCEEKGHLTWVFKPDAIYTYLISGNYPLWVWGFSNFPRLDSPENTSVCCNRPRPSRNEKGWLVHNHLWTNEFLFHLEKLSTAWHSSNRAVTTSESSAPKSKDVCWLLGALYDSYPKVPP